MACTGLFRVEIRLVRLRACACALHVISYVVFKYLVCIEIVTVRLVANAPLSFSLLVPTVRAPFLRTRPMLTHMKIFLAP